MNEHVWQPWMVILLCISSTSPLTFKVPYCWTSVNSGWGSYTLHRCIQWHSQDPEVRWIVQARPLQHGLREHSRPQQRVTSMYCPRPSFFFNARSAVGLLSLVDKGATTRSVMLSEAGVTATVPQWLHCTLTLVQRVELSGHGTALPGLCHQWMHSVFTLLWSANEPHP